MNGSSMPKGQKLNLNIDYRFVALGLAAVIIVMLFFWQPWATKATNRTIEVTGQSTISAKPDEFVFYPSYDFAESSKEVALEKLTAKSNEVVAGLKNLGVADKNIKTNSDAWAYPTARIEGSDTTTTYSLRLTVTTDSDSLTQKVQDYLISTIPTGSISPQATFSDAKLKEIQEQGRDAASKDARKKADQSAKNLGFKISGVKTVNDGVGFGGVYPLNSKAESPEAVDLDMSMTVQPGESDLDYTITVTYYIR